MSVRNNFVQTSLFGIIVVLFAISCKQSTQTDESEETTASTPPVETKYQVSPLGSSPDYAGARLEAMEYKNGQFNFRIGGDSYKLGVQTPDAPTKGCANSGQGQHIHLIVDNEPYAAKYEATFDYQIADGEHYILAFLSRSYHESLKSRDCAIAVKAQIADNGIASAQPISEPMLFYSRPKGTYEGEDTRRILLDYYLVNPKPDHQVRATINGENHLLASWQPYIIEGLPAGENEITLTLIDSDGNRVNTALNPVTRKIIVTPDPPVN